MTTNREWLYSLQPDELTAWFDAKHDDSVALDAENPTDSFMDSCDCKDGELTIDGAYFADSREKLEADASELTADYAASGDVCDALYGGIVGLLDRQAAITERELCKQCDWPSLAAQPDLESQERIAELTDDLETAYAKNRVLRAHIRKMQNGRNGWHIKAKKLQKQLSELTAQVEKFEKDKRIGWECECKLQAERDALADDLLTCNKEREEYRELFSKAITHAHEIVNLQP